MPKIVSSKDIKTFASKGKVPITDALHKIQIDSVTYCIYLAT